MAERKTSILENVFECILFNCRFVTIVAVLGSLLASIAMFAKATMQVINGILALFHEMHLPTGNVEVGHDNSSLVALFVSSVDEYLFATVLLIFSMGLYELFISKLDPASRKKDTRPNWLRIESIDDLKGSLGKVILMILIVSFFQYSLHVEFKTALDLLLLGVGILLISAALYLVHLQHEKPEETSAGEKSAEIPEEVSGFATKARQIFHTKILQVLRESYPLASYIKEVDGGWCYISIPVRDGVYNLHINYDWKEIWLLPNDVSSTSDEAAALADRMTRFTECAPREWGACECVWYAHTMYPELEDYDGTEYMRELYTRYSEHSEQAARYISEMVAALERPVE
jgi:uncharacterized membrane protein YqhA